MLGSVCPMAAVTLSQQPGTLGRKAAGLITWLLHSNSTRQTRFVSCCMACLSAPTSPQLSEKQPFVWGQASIACLRDV